MPGRGGSAPLRSRRAAPGPLPAGRAHGAAPAALGHGRRGAAGRAAGPAGGGLSARGSAAAGRCQRRAGRALGRAGPVPELRASGCHPAALPPLPPQPPHRHLRASASAFLYGAAAAALPAARADSMVARLARCTPGRAVPGSRPRARGRPGAGARPPPSAARRGRPARVTSRAPIGR